MHSVPRDNSRNNLKKLPKLPKSFLQSVKSILDIPDLSKLTIAQLARHIKRSYSITRRICLKLQNFDVLEIGKFYPRTVKLTDFGKKCKRGVVREDSRQPAYFAYLKEVLLGCSVKQTSLSIVDLHGIAFSYPVLVLGTLPDSGSRGFYSYRVNKDVLYVYLGKNKRIAGSDPVDLVCRARSESDEVVRALCNKYNGVIDVSTGRVFSKPHFHCSGVNLKPCKDVRFRFSNGILSVDGSGGVELDLIGVDNASIISLIIEAIKKEKLSD